MPMMRRVAKRGFNNRFHALVVHGVNVGDLDRCFEDGDTVDAVALAQKGLAKGRYDQLKILGDGPLTKKLTIIANQFSTGALEKIEAAGGKATVG